MSTRTWDDDLPLPSLDVWHHYLMVQNRGTPLNSVWIDGVAQTLTPGTHDAGAYNNCPNQTIYFGNHPSGLYVQGAMAEMALFPGTLFGLNQAKALTAGARVTEMPTKPSYYWPLFGADSPEPDYGGTRKSATVSGTVASVPHPGIQPGLLAA